MQRFDIREQQVVAARGRYLRWETDSGQPIAVRAGGLDFGQVWPGELLELPEAAEEWQITPGADETGFVRVGMARIDSPRKASAARVPILVMQTDSAQVAAGAGPGWVSGTPASLAGGASTTVVFDLGPEWRQYGVLEATIWPGTPSTGLNPVQFYGSDLPAVNLGRRRGPLTATGQATHFLNVASASGSQSVTMRPAGRFLVITVTNGDASNAQAPSARITLTAYP